MGHPNYAQIPIVDIDKPSVCAGLPPITCSSFEKRVFEIKIEKNVRAANELLMVLEFKMPFCITFEVVEWDEEDPTDQLKHNYFENKFY